MGIPRRPALACLAAALLAACGVESPSPSAAPGVSVPPDDAECRRINLLGPSGTSVVLTGDWRSNDLSLGLYNLYQNGSCLYWLGMSQWPGAEPGSHWTTLFFGTLQSDLTIVGRWADVPFNPEYTAERLTHGTMTLQIGFDQSGGAEHPVLRVVNETGGYAGGYARARDSRDWEGVAWVPEESLPAAIEFEGTFGGNWVPALDDPALDTGCVWVEANGQRYELIGNGGLEILGRPTIRVEDRNGHVVAQLDDPVRIRGRVSEALGTNCVETAILVEELDPTP